MTFCVFLCSWQFTSFGCNFASNTCNYFNNSCCLMRNTLVHTWKTKEPDFQAVFWLIFYKPSFISTCANDFKGHEFGLTLLIFTGHIKIKDCSMDCAEYGKVWQCFNRKVMFSWHLTRKLLLKLGSPAKSNKKWDPSVNKFPWYQLAFSILTLSPKIDTLYILMTAYFLKHYNHRASGVII